MFWWWGFSCCAKKLFRYNERKIRLCVRYGIKRSAKPSEKFPSKFETTLEKSELINF